MKRKKVEIWLTRDGTHGLRDYFLFACCKPIYDRDTWVCRADCESTNGAQPIDIYPAELFLTCPMKGGPRSIRRLV